LFDVGALYAAAGPTIVGKFRRHFTDHFLRRHGKIWQRIAKLGAEPEPRAKPTAHGVPAKGKAKKKATAAKAAAPKRNKTSKTPSAKTPSTPRAGSKMAQAIALMERKGGVTISELMQSMGWQRHTVRGFMAGAMKKAELHSITDPPGQLRSIAVSLAGC
jgi:hypothetical protein